MRKKRRRPPTTKATTRPRRERLGRGFARIPADPHGEAEVSVQSPGRDPGRHVPHRRGDGRGGTRPLRARGLQLPDLRREHGHAPAVAVGADQHEQGGAASAQPPAKTPLRGRRRHSGAPHPPGAGGRREPDGRDGRRGQRSLRDGCPDRRGLRRDLRDPGPVDRAGPRIHPTRGRGRHAGDRNRVGDSRAGLRRSRAGRPIDTDPRLPLSGRRGHGGAWLALRTVAGQPRLRPLALSHPGDHGPSGQCGRHHHPGGQRRRAPRHPDADRGDHAGPPPAATRRRGGFLSGDRRRGNQLLGQHLTYALHGVTDARVDLAGGRRHRDHEHHAGVGDGADSRNRGQKSTRRAPERHPHASAHRGGDAVDRGGRVRRRGRPRYRKAHRRRVDHAGRGVTSLDRGRRDLGAIRRGHRRGVPGLTGLQARPRGRATL